MLNISASPFHAGKGREREEMLRARARDSGVWLAYCNLVGGQDELVFDGRSVVVSPEGEVVARARAFEEDLLDRGLLAAREARRVGRRRAARLGPAGGLRCAEARTRRLHAQERFRARGPRSLRRHRLGAHRHPRRRHARSSARPRGPDAVAVLLRGQRGRRSRARGGARIDVAELSIEPVFQALSSTLDPAFEGRAVDVTEENLQARVRGTLLMALSNKNGWLVLATGNKSELSVGYSTLYGDMVGGFAPLKDVFKTRVQELAAWRNAAGAVIPEATLAKPPSAELRQGQVDEDTLPPYVVLDSILAAYVEQDRSVDEIVETGHDRGVVERVCRMVDASEYKRRQGPMGIRVTPRAFGKDRRMPVTSGYRR